MYILFGIMPFILSVIGNCSVVFTVIYHSGSIIFFLWLLFSILLNHFLNVRHLGYFPVRASLLPYSKH